VLAQLLAALGGETPVETASQVFDALAAECPPFEGLSWDGLGDGGLVAGAR
jgi:hypothetical protein